ncbi:MAG: hypothetical protein IAE67_10350 [Candidatus Competibacteraceae bacterium]|nr:hypothetical protein [Candidatus Competibacteraceae bacterium]
MKRFLLYLFMIFFLGGCSALTHFTLHYDEEITISPGLGIGIPYTSATPSFPTNTAIPFQNNNTNKDLLEGCRLSSMRAELLTPDGYDFSFLNTIEVFLSAPLMAEVKIAFANDIPETIGTELVFSMTNEELVEYIKQDNLIIRITTTQDKITTQEVKAQLYMSFFVDANILGM